MRTVLRTVLLRGRWIALLVGGITLLWGCGSSSPSAVDPHSPQASHIAGLFWLMFWLAVVVYIVVLVFVAMSFRSRRGSEDGSPPGPAGEQDGNTDEWSVPSQPDATERRRGHRFIVVGGLALPSIVLAVVAVATVRTTNAVRPGTSVIAIDVQAERWWWRLTYPGDHVVTANEIHVPIGEPVDLTLTSDNVIHSVWVPELNGKTDVIPGHTNHLTFVADATGTYRGQCAEFCGIGHALMAFVVVVDSPGDYSRWLAHNAAPAAEPQAGAAQQGATYFANASCAGCHTVSGTQADGTLGPDLTHFASRTSIAAGTLPNTPANLALWLSDTQGVKPGSLMPDLDLTDAQIADLVAYLDGLR